MRCRRFNNRAGANIPTVLASHWLRSLADGTSDGSGLVYLRNPYYDPKTGQFTQEDPIGLADGMNLYGFAGGDPVNFSDPFGLCPPQDRDWTTCEPLQAGANWAASNSHPTLLNIFAGTHAVLEAFGEMSSPESGGIGGPANAAVAITARGSSLTYLYQKLGAAGEHLKFGISKNPATRYTASELAGGRLKLLAKGLKDEMLALERSLHETLPIGPEEGQKFYAGKQAAKGLNTPP